MIIEQIKNSVLALVTLGGIGSISLIPSLAGGGKEPVELYTGWREPRDFKRYCYGNIIQGIQEGDMLVCDSSNNKLRLFGPLFFLYWGENQKFYRISHIKVENGTGSNWNVSFTFYVQTLGRAPDNRKLVVQKSQNNGLDGLSDKELSKTCKIQKDHYSNLKLQCNNGASSFNPMLKKSGSIFG